MRRAALHAADIADPDKDYFFDARLVLRALQSGKALFRTGASPPLYDFANGHCLYMAQFADEMLSLKLAQFAVQYLLELSYIRPAITRSAQMKAAFNLQRRFAREILEYLHG